MYGTIFNLKVKAGHEEEVLSLFKEESITNNPSGGIAWFIMNPDDKGDWIGITIFQTKEAYLANVNRPEQHESFLKIPKHLDT